MGFYFIFSVKLEEQVRAFACGEQHERHNTFCVDERLFFPCAYGAAVASGGAGEFGGCAGVQAEFVDYFDSAANH